MAVRNSNPDPSGVKDNTVSPADPVGQVQTRLRRGQLIAWLHQNAGGQQADLIAAMLTADADLMRAAERVCDCLTSAWSDVRAERDRQDAQWGGPAHDDTHTNRDWFFYIGHQQANHSRGKQDARQAFVKIAALALAAIESIDRKESVHSADPSTVTP